MPFLHEGSFVLDVGCGPGSITRDIANKVGIKGKVIGIDREKAAVESSNNLLGGLTNLTFAQANVYKLPFPDNHFDVVHAHMVLQHLVNPVDALKERKRVTKTGGVVAARDSEYSSMKSYPKLEGIERWRKVYLETCYRNKAEPDAGLFLKDWFIKSGFQSENIKYSLSAKLYDENIDKEDKKEWGYAWADRVLNSSFGKQALEYGISDLEELEYISKTWKEWAKLKDSIFYYVSGEAVAKKI